MLNTIFTVDIMTVGHVGFCQTFNKMAPSVKQNYVIKQGKHYSVRLIDSCIFVACKPVPLPICKGLLSNPSA